MYLETLKKLDYLASTNPEGFKALFTAAALAQSKQHNFAMSAKWLLKDDSILPAAELHVHSPEELSLEASIDKVLGGIKSNDRHFHEVIAWIEDDVVGAAMLGKVSVSE